MDDGEKYKKLRHKEFAYRFKKIKSNGMKMSYTIALPGPVCDC